MTATPEANASGREILLVPYGVLGTGVIDAASISWIVRAQSRLSQIWIP
jgi:hypothetical protein